MDGNLPAVHIIYSTILLASQVMTIQGPLAKPDITIDYCLFVC